MKPNAIFAAAVLSIVGILIVPLPPVLLDALLALNIFGSALVLLISLRVEDPLEFSPSRPRCCWRRCSASRSTSARRA
jgi:flagellar biosynthesis protein FlhA